MARCGEWPPPVPLRRSAARGDTEHRPLLRFAAKVSSQAAIMTCLRNWNGRVRGRHLIMIMQRLIFRHFPNLNFDQLSRPL